MRLVTCLVLLVLFVPGLCVAAIPAATASSAGNHTVYWSEDWENGIGLWSASNGVWDVGTPSYGTSDCIGQQCAATVLAGKYPYNTNSRLESVSITLPNTPADGVLWLGFWHWFSNSASYGTDYGSVQIWTETDGWVEASDHFIRGSSVWTPYYLDITAYAGQTIKIGFYFFDDHSHDYQSAGWYVDQIQIFDGSFPFLSQINRFDKTTDMDWDGWYPDQGIWELGEPNSGITQAHSAHQCFGTNLNGNYPYAANSRLISPSVTLDDAPLDGKLYFSFQQYCSLSSSYGTDQGHIQINDGTGWTTLDTENWHNNLGAQWTEKVFDISAYAGKKVNLGFVIDDDSSHNYQSYGWYIDDLQFSEGSGYIGNPERFENFAPNWFSAEDVWEVGEPTYGPSAAYSPPNCWGTNLDGQYPFGTSDRLETPLISLPSAGGLFLRFQQWYSFSGSYGIDYGEVSIKTEGEDWVALSSHFTGSSGGWVQFSYDLSAYAGQTIKIGFHLFDDHSHNYRSAGWYIDDFEIVGMPENEAPLAPLALNVAINSGPAQLTFPHVTDNIDKVIVYGSPVEGFQPTLGTRLMELPGDVFSWTDTDRPGWPATYYRVSVVDSWGNESIPIVATDISAVPDLPPVAGLITLKGAVPNPFNPRTLINFNLPRTMAVNVAIYDLRGHKVANLLHKTLAPGPHKVPFAPRNLASGTYFAQVKAENQVQTKKILLLK